MESQSYTAKTVVLLQNLDAGVPTPDIFKIAESKVNAADVPQGGLLLQVLAMSADPYLRGQIRSTGAIKQGCPMSGFVSGKVLVSNNVAWKADDLFGGSLPFSTFQIVTSEHLMKTVMWKLTGLINED